MVSAIPAGAALYPIVVKVEEKSERDRVGEHGRVIRQNLTVTCQNTVQDAFPNLVVRCDFFARDQKSGTLVIVKRDEKPIQLGLKESVDLTFGVVTEYTEDYDKAERKTTGTGKNRKTQTKVIEVKGTGEKYAGYVIRVYAKDDPDKWLGEFSDSEMLRKAADTAMIKAAPKPPAKKK